MTATVALRPGGLWVRWRLVECLGVSLGLFIQSGALFVLLLSEGSGPGSPGQRILQLLVLPVYAFTLLVLARHPGQFMYAIRRNIPLIALLALIVLSTVWSISPSVTVRRTFALLMSLQLSFVLAIRFSATQILLLVAVVLGSSMLLSLLAIGLLPGLAWMPDSGELRGIYSHKNVLGWFAATSLLLSSSLIARPDLGLRPTAILIFLCSLVCLMLSESGTSLIAAFLMPVFAAYYVALARSRPVTRVVLVLLAVQILALVIFSLDGVLAPLLGGTGKDVSLTGRVPLWELVGEAIRDRPFLGYGYQAFWTDGSGSAWTIWTKLAWPAPHAHNGYLDTMLSLGLVGTITLVITLVTTLWKGGVMQCRPASGEWLWLNIYFCVTLVMNLTESTLLNQNSLLFILFTTAIVKFSMEEKIR